MIAYLLLCVFIVFSNVWFYGKIYSYFFPSVVITNYYVNPKTITISGMSSGGAFSSQFGFAFSKKIHGVGILSGIHYYCAENSMEMSINRCMKANGIPETDYFVNKIKGFSKDRLIDQLGYVTKQKVFVFHSKKDDVVEFIMQEHTCSLYENFLKDGNLKKVLDVESPHAFITDSNGDVCNFESQKEPYVVNCNYDTAANVLAFLLNIKNVKKKDLVVDNFYKFSQKKYDGVSMGENGFIYVPTACKDEETMCNLHVHFHGCKQGYDNVGLKYINGTGFNHVAEANNIIMLYPQITKIKNNPFGCWDWWGYSGEYYAFKSGSQMKAVEGMIDDLIQNKFVLYVGTVGEIKNEKEL